MKYKLIKEINPQYSVIQQILTNRGIDFNEIHHYLNTTDKDINDAEMFGSDIIKQAMLVLAEAIKENKDTLVLVDCDCDRLYLRRNTYKLFI